MGNSSTLSQKVIVGLSLVPRPSLRETTSGLPRLCCCCNTKSSWSSSGIKTVFIELSILFVSSVPLDIINYLVKCFTYSMCQNKGNPTALQKPLKSILPHSFGDHKNCNESWCGAKKDPIN